MIEIYNDVVGRLWRKNPFSPEIVEELDLRVGDSPVLKAYFLLPTTDPKGPFAVTRFASATVAAQLLDPGNNVLSTANLSSEIAPATTAPAITRITSGTAAIGEYDRITFASPPGSGNYGIAISGGTGVTKGATSASAKIYPGVTSEAEAASAFAAMVGSPYAVAFVSPTIVDVHGTAVSSGGVPRVTGVDVLNLQYLFGWMGTLDLLTNAANIAPFSAYDGDTPQVSLVLKLTPSGGALTTTLKLLVNLWA